MEHEDALRIRAVEKYFLGQLAEPDRDAFEAHYFECELCAAEIRAGVILADNAAAEFGGPAARAVPVERKRSWRDWFRMELLGWRQPGFALPAMALVAVAALWTLDHRHLAGELAQAEAPQMIDGVRADEARGAAPVVERTSRFVSLSFFIDNDTRSAYAIDITGGGTRPVTLETGRKPRYEVLLPAAVYGPGTYHIAVRGAGTSEVLQQFDVDLK